MTGLWNMGGRSQSQHGRAFVIPAMPALLYREHQQLYIVWWSTGWKVCCGTFLEHSLFSTIYENQDVESISVNLMKYFDQELCIYRRIIDKSNNSSTTTLRGGRKVDSRFIDCRHFDCRHIAKCDSCRQFDCRLIARLSPIGFGPCLGISHPNHPH